MKKLLILCLMALMLSGCAGWWGQVKVADGCAVWDVQIPDKVTEAGVRDVIVTACAPTIVGIMESIEQQVGEFVAVNDVKPCLREECPEAAKLMLRNMKVRPIAPVDPAVKKLLSE